MHAGIRMWGAIAAIALTGCASAPRHDSPTLRFDYAGAEALIQTLSQGSLTPDQLTRLRNTHGVTAMVDNATRYIPEATRARFESDLRVFFETNEEPRYGKYRVWGFQPTLDSRDEIVKLLQELRRRENELTEQVIATLRPFQPDTGPLAIDVYFVVGGVSDGFVTQRGEQRVLYVNLGRAQGDAAGVIQNLTHEVYHVMQQAAARKMPELQAMLDALDRLPLPERLVAETLWEGTANYAADARRSAEKGPYIDMWRSMYERNLTPGRIAENFALFDSLLSDLTARRISWDEAYSKGFSGPESRLYFVGYEMARVIDQHCGRACIGKLFQQPPVEFFRQYIALYKAQSDVPARFSEETERWIREQR